MVAAGPGGNGPAACNPVDREGAETGAASLSFDTGVHRPRKAEPFLESSRLSSGEIQIVVTLPFVQGRTLRVAKNRPSLA